MTPKEKKRLQVKIDQLREILIQAARERSRQDTIALKRFKRLEEMEARLRSSI